MGLCTEDPNQNTMPKDSPEVPSTEISWHRAPTAITVIVFGTYNASGLGIIGPAGSECVISDSGFKTLRAAMTGAGSNE